MNFKHMLFRAASALLLVSGLGFAGCDDADPDLLVCVRGDGKAPEKVKDLR